MIGPADGLDYWFHDEVLESLLLRIDPTGCCCICLYSGGKGKGLCCKPLLTLFDTGRL